MDARMRGHDGKNTPTPHLSKDRIILSEYHRHEGFDKMTEILYQFISSIL